MTAASPAAWQKDDWQDAKSAQTVPTVEYYDKYFGKGRWRSSTVVSLSIGQGELGITPLQMANTMCIIANRGYFYIPHIMKKVGDKPQADKKFTNKEPSGMTI